MLEERITELSNRITVLTSAIEDLSRQLPGANAVAQADASMEEPAAPAEQPKEEAAPAAETTLDDVRAALIAYKNRHDRQTTLDLLRRFVPEGQQLVVGNVPRDRYADLVSAAQEE